MTPYSSSYYPGLLIKKNKEEKNKNEKNQEKGNTSSSLRGRAHAPSSQVETRKTRITVGTRSESQTSRRNSSAGSGSDARSIYSSVSSHDDFTATASNTYSDEASASEDQGKDRKTRRRSESADGGSVKNMSQKGSSDSRASSSYSSSSVSSRDDFSTANDAHSDEAGSDEDQVMARVSTRTTRHDARSKNHKSTREKLGAESPDGSSARPVGEDPLFSVNDTRVSSEEGGGQFESFDTYDAYITKKHKKYLEKGRFKEDGTLKKNLGERLEHRSAIISNALRTFFRNPQQTGTVFSVVGQEWLYAVYSLAIVARGVGAGTKEWGGGMGSAAADINAVLVGVAAPCAVLSAATIGRDALVIRSKVGMAKRIMIKAQENAQKYVKAMREGGEVEPQSAQAYLEFMAYSKSLANSKLQGSKKMSRERDRTTINGVRAVGLQLGMNTPNMNVGAIGVATGTISPLTSVSSTGVVTSVIGVINGVMYLQIGRIEYQKAMATKKDMNRRMDQLKGYRASEAGGDVQDMSREVTLQVGGKEFKIALVENMDAFLHRKHDAAVRERFYAKTRLFRGGGDIAFGAASGGLALALATGAICMATYLTFGVPVVVATAVAVAAYLGFVVAKFKDKHRIEHLEKRHQRLAQMLIDSHTEDELRELFMAKVTAHCRLVSIDHEGNESVIKIGGDDDPEGAVHSGTASGEAAERVDREPGTITLSEILTKYREKGLCSEYEVGKEREFDVTQNEYLCLHFMALAVQRLMAKPADELPAFEQACIGMIKLTVKEEDLQAIVDGAHGFENTDRQLMFIKKYLAKGLGIEFRLVKNDRKEEYEMPGVSRLFQKMELSESESSNDLVGDDSGSWDGADAGIGEVRIKHINARDGVVLLEDPVTTEEESVGRRHRRNVPVRLSLDPVSAALSGVELTRKMEESRQAAVTKKVPKEAERAEKTERTRKIEKEGFTDSERSHNISGGDDNTDSTVSSAASNRSGKRDERGGSLGGEYPASSAHAPTRMPRAGTTVNVEHVLAAAELAPATPATGTPKARRGLRISPEFWAELDSRKAQAAGIAAAAVSPAPSTAGVGAKKDPEKATV